MHLPLSVAALSSEAGSCLQINMFLRVMRRRKDGYHDLASLFHVSPGFFLLGYRKLQTVG